LGRKYKSYNQAYMDGKMIRMIADEELDAPLYDDDAGYKIYGDFDVQVDVVDEFQEDFVQAGQELQLLQTVAANPQLLESNEHKVHTGEWLKSIMRRLNVHDVDAVVTPAGGVDAKLRQRQENRYMIEEGKYLEPTEGEDHDRHLVELNAEILRWKPIVGHKLDPSDGEGLEQQVQANNVLDLFLYPHQAAHEAMKLEAASASQQQQGVRQPAEQTPGQEAGNEAAGQLGALQPQ
jgi:hypothetical protein